MANSSNINTFQLMSGIPQGDPGQTNPNIPGIDNPKPGAPDLPSKNNPSNNTWPDSSLKPSGVYVKSKIINGVL